MPIRRKYRIKSSRNKQKRKVVKKQKGFLLSSFDFAKKPVYKKRLIKKPISKSILKKLFSSNKETKNRKSLFVKMIKFVFKICVLLFFIGIFAAAGVFLYFSKDIPNPDEIVDRSVAESTKIYDRTGEHLLYEIHGEEKRTIVKIDQISKHLIDATVASEDKNFYKHKGIDFKGIARAFFRDVSSGKKLEGGSTITQQLIKNSILTPERTLARKIKEIILSIETERKFTKDQIMEMYLNQIPYGSNAYGIEAASQTFFGKSAKDLDISESALLASLPRATTYYSPYGANPGALEARYKYVIDNMLEEGYISSDEAKKAKEEKILSKVKPFSENIEAPHFVMYVKQKLVDEFGEEKVEKGGLKVYTTLSYDMQILAEDSVKKGAARNLKKYNAGNASLVAIDPRTGQILAMVGSKDYFNVKEDGNVNVALAKRQPGSSFKPFVYATAFKKGYTQNTILFDLYTNFGKDGSGKEFRPNNYNFKFSGPVTMKNALARSLNIPAVKTLYLAGIEDSAKTAKDMGITTIDNSKNYGLSFALGTSEVRLLDMVSSYSVFANDGVKNPPVSIMKIEDSDGKILKKFEDKSKRVLDVEVARNINAILSDNSARSATFGINNSINIKGVTVAAKTGTTSDYKDAWTIGYTPSLAAGVWVGNNKGEKMKRAGGILAAAPIWNNFMTRILTTWEKEEFIPPEPIKSKKPILNGKYKNEVTVKIDKACGDKLANELTPESQIEEKTYIEVHNILYYVKKDDPQGDYPKNPYDDQMFLRWEGPVLEWAKKNANEVNVKPPNEVCKIRSADKMPTVKITFPKNNKIVDDYKLSIKTEASSFSGISQIDFYFDNTLIGIGKISPYEIYYKIPNETKLGFHNITVKAYDGIGNIAEDNISVVVSDDPNIYIESITGDDFPFTINAVSSDETKSVSFYYQLYGTYDSNMKFIKKTGNIYKIKEARQPQENNLYNVLWDDDKEYFILGRYKIFAVSKDYDGKSHVSNEVYLEIK